MAQGGATWLAVSVGDHYACGITSDRAAYCWGTRNGLGQLGAGTVGDTSAQPRRVVGRLEFRAISAGLRHTCGVTTAGRVVCWGSDEGGALGGSPPASARCGAARGACSARPVEVDAGALTFDSVTAGLAHSCARSTKGTVHCWGGDAAGQRGRPARGGSGLASVCCTPALTTVDAGTTFTCALSAAGAAYCWGSDLLGELGIDRRAIGTCAYGGYAAAPCSPTPVTVSGALKLAAISAAVPAEFNAEPRVCGLSLRDEVYCWGAGLLATQARFSTTPNRMDGGRRFASLSVGATHLCGVGRDGRAYCWGRNEYGQIGDGTTAGREQPVRVAGTLSFAQISAGVDQTCGITTAGAAYCWGAGIGYAPTPVPDP